MRGRWLSRGLPSMLERLRLLVMLERLRLLVMLERLRLLVMLERLRLLVMLEILRGETVRKPRGDPSDVKD
jgi:hypothetical protein